MEYLNEENVTSFVVMSVVMMLLSCIITESEITDLSVTYAFGPVYGLILWLGSLRHI
jgi:hypothetical protein